MIGPEWLSLGNIQTVLQIGTSISDIMEKMGVTKYLKGWTKFISLEDNSSMSVKSGSFTISGDLLDGKKVCGIVYFVGMQTNKESCIDAMIWFSESEFTPVNNAFHQTFLRTGNLHLRMLKNDSDGEDARMDFIEMFKEEWEKGKSKSS